MNSSERNLYAVWFALLLLLAPVFALIGYVPKTIPTGLNPETPKFEATRLLDDDYYRAIDFYVQNQLPTQGFGLWTRAQVDYKLFGSSPVPSITAGLDNWLFFTNYLHIDCAGFDTTSPFQSFSLTKDQLVYVVSEPKTSFHSDRLREFQRPEQCETEWRHIRRDAIRTDPVGMEINEQLERLSADIDVFTPTDTHWSPFARTKVAQRIVNRFSPDLWVQAELQPTETALVTDLSNGIGLDEAITIQDFAPNDTDVEILSEARADYRDLVVNQTTHSNRADAIPGVTLIVGDSQMAYTLPYLHPYFEDLIFVNWLVVDIGKTKFPEIGPVDRIVIQSIEAAWPSRSASPAIADFVGKLKP